MGFVIGLVIGVVAGWLLCMRFSAPFQAFVLRRRGGTPPPIHTSKADEGWQVTQDGESRTIGEFPTKAKAQAAGDEVARSAGTDHIIHKADGSVGTEHHFGEAAAADKD